MTHRARVKLTVCHQGLALTARPGLGTRSCMPGIVALTDDDARARVPLAGTPFECWPDVVSTLDFDLRVTPGPPPQRLTRVNQPPPLPERHARAQERALSPAITASSSTIWQELFNSIKAQPLKPDGTELNALRSESLHVFPATAVADDLRTLHQNSARAVFQRIARLAAESEGREAGRSSRTSCRRTQAVSCTGKVAASTVSRPFQAISQATAFYKRPEPTIKLTAAQAQNRDDDADFHQWVARYGHQPWLLRELGLLLDFELEWLQLWG